MSEERKKYRIRRKNYERPPGTFGSSGNSQTCAFDANEIPPTAPRVIFIEAVGAKRVPTSKLDTKVAPKKHPNRVTKRLWFHDRECLLNYLMHTLKRK